MWGRRSLAAAHSNAWLLNTYHPAFFLNRALMSLLRPCHEAVRESALGVFAYLLLAFRLVNPFPLRSLITVCLRNAINFHALALASCILYTNEVILCAQDAFFVQITKKAAWTVKYRLTTLGPGHPSFTKAFLAHFAGRLYRGHFNASARECAHLLCEDPSMVQIAKKTVQIFSFQLTRL